MRGTSARPSSPNIYGRQTLRHGFFVSMPDLLGYDGRTARSKFATNALAAGLAAGIQATKSYNFWGSSTMAPYGRRARRYLPKYRPSRRFRRKRVFRRTAKKVVGRRRGKRYIASGAKINRPLLNNFNVNDYQKIRVSAAVGIMNVSGVPSISNNSRFVLQLDTWTTDWAAVIEEFDEFKFTNVQFVLSPQFRTSGGIHLTAANGDIPYIALRTVNPTTPALVNISTDQLRQTPGVRFINLNKQSRTVHNVMPSITKSIDQVDALATTKFESHARMPWTKINADTKAHDYAAVEVREPILDALNTTSDFTWKYEVRVYATIHLRGRKGGEIIPPY